MDVCVCSHPWTVSAWPVLQKLAKAPTQERVEYGEADHTANHKKDESPAEVVGHYAQCGACCRGLLCIGGSHQKDT